MNIYKSYNNKTTDIYQLSKSLSRDTNGITLVYKHVITRKWENGIEVVRFLFAFNVRPAIV